MLSVGGITIGKVKNFLASSILAFSLALQPSLGLSQPVQQISAVKDGLYDNHNTFVDESKMSLDAILESVEVISHTTTYHIVYEDLQGQIFDFYHSVSSGGSGVVIDKKDGKAYILTNNHLIDSVTLYNFKLDGSFKNLKIEKVGDKVYVLKDGYYVDADIYALDSVADAAIISVDDSSGFKKFPYQIGNSDDLHSGDFVYIIGNPLGLVDYVIDGNVSLVDYPYNSDWFMINCGVQPGFSGGAVVAVRDGEFELVGLVSATLVRSVGEGESVDALGGYGIAVKINKFLELYGKKKS